MTTPSGGARAAGEAAWLVPSLICTIALGVFAGALILTMDFRGLPDPGVSLASWVGWTFMACFAAVGLYTLKLRAAGNERPIRVLSENLRRDWRRYAIIPCGMFLAGLDMYFFMIVKPQLNSLFPFWADPLLAQLDRALLGTDGWRLLEPLTTEAVAWVYSPGWYFTILLTFFWVLLRPPSITKGSVLLSYFVIWSVFGPVGQAIVPAGGPIFFTRLGYGDAFADMRIPELSQFLSNYLWATYEARSLAPGAGISAMPSLHIATMAWAVVAFASFRSRWTVPVLLLSFFIYAASIALGWHYAMDGIVGALGAVLSYLLAKVVIGRGAFISAGSVRRTASPVDANA